MKFKLPTIIPAAICFGFASFANAATWTVNSTADAPDADTTNNICEATAAAGDCTLRAAIQQAASGDTITFSVTGTITLDPALGELLIDKSLTVQGPGAAQLAVSGNDAVRVLHVEGDSLTLAVSGVTIEHGGGTGSGGAVYIKSVTSDGGVSFTDCVITATTLDAANYPRGAGLYIDSYAPLTLTRTTVSQNAIAGNGFGYGAGISTINRGTVTIANCQIINNSSVGMSGGGLYLAGSSAVNITDSVVSGNTIATNTTGYYFSGYGAGGVISTSAYRQPDGTLTIARTTFENNSIQTPSTSRNGVTGQGGGLEIDGTGAMSITDSTFHGNSAVGNSTNYGGAIYTGGGSVTNPILIQNCTFTGNYVKSTGSPGAFNADNTVQGGAISATSAYVNVVASNFTGNYAQSPSSAYGGAIMNSNVLSLTDCAFSSNEAKFLDVANPTYAAGGAVATYGGDASRLTILRSTLSGNAAEAGTAGSNGAAVYVNGGIFTLTDSTIGSNTATAAAGATAYGGGIYLKNANSNGTVVYLNNSTIARNTAGSGVETATGGGVYNPDGTVHSNNTIIALNQAFDATNAGSSAPSDCFGAFTSGGYNVIGVGDGSTGFVNGTNGDQVGTAASPLDPKLADLGSYNGPTQTFALMAGSPAIDAGDPAFDPNAFAPALTTDQRGMPRVRNGRIDIGAYEAPAPPAVTSPTNNARTTATPLLSATVEPFQTVIFTITGGSSPVTVTRIADANGNVSVNAPALAEGTYSLSATAELFSELPSNPSSAITFVVDATAPVISGMPANMTVEATGPNGAAVTYSQPTATDNIDGSVPVTCSPLSGSTFALGTTMVTCSASDQAGNTARASFNVTVRDTTAPTISNVPADITTTATSPDGAVVTYNNPTATDAVSGNVPVTCRPASGSTFPIGTTAVTCSATDAANNTATAKFNITVEAPSPTPTPTATPPATPTPTASPSPTPAQALNLSTRGDVLTGENVMIGGFIITGNAPKKVVVRAIGPSTGIAGALADPVLELHGPSGFTTIVNDDWQDASNANDIPAALQPKDAHESAILITLDPGAYTGIVRGKDGATGVALVEVFDVSSDVPSQLANISTRAFVQTQDNVMIGGFILGGASGSTSNVIVRAIGPSLAQEGVANPLADPVLDIRNKDGSPVATNDNWQDDANASKVSDNGVAPKSQLEAALYLTLPPGEYTAIVSGNGSSSGVGLVEVYHLP